uniref:Uncharacterized protein n=1 Tax=Ralstonia solanacearum TaxID=305 RepID=A0A0S4W937_RALSL|nr:protein of unknown function [Ralstonia solanacearum]
MQSAADLAIAAPNVTNQGAISTPGNVSISGGVANTGSVVAGGNVAIAGPQIVNTGTIGAGVDANGGVTQAGSVALNAAGTVRNGGSLLAGQDIGVNAGSVDTGNGGVNARGQPGRVAGGGRRCGGRSWFGGQQRRHDRLPDGPPERQQHGRHRQRWRQADRRAGCVAHRHGPGQPGRHGVGAQSVDQHGDRRDRQHRRHGVCRRYGCNRCGGTG